MVEAAFANGGTVVAIAELMSGLFAKVGGSDVVGLVKIVVAAGGAVSGNGGKPFAKSVGGSWPSSGSGGGGGKNVVRSVAAAGAAETKSG